MNDYYVEQHTSKPYQIKAEKEKMPVAYLGLGILEWHGEHNAAGLDGVKANGIAIHFAKKFSGIVLPPLYWGDHRGEICELVFKPEIISSAEFDHTIPICEKIGYDKQKLEKNAKRCDLDGGWDLWIRLLTHIFFELESFGYKCIVPIPGHYPLFTPLDTAIEKYKFEGGVCDIFTIKDTMFDETEFSGDHAAKFETSLMLAMYPELVDLSLLDQDRKKPNIGVLGIDPRDNASKEFGIEIIDKFDELLQIHLKEIDLIK
jgi:creatinine amidohydrolase